MTGKDGNTPNSIILHGMEKVYANVPNVAYYNYIKAHVDAYKLIRFHQRAGTEYGQDPSWLLCLFLYGKNGLTKYKTAAKKPWTITSGHLPENTGWLLAHKNTAAYKNG